MGDDSKHSLVFLNPHPIELDESLECDVNVITHAGETYRLDSALTFDRTNQRLVRVTTTTEERSIHIIKAKTEK